MAISKIILNGVTQMDLTQDTVAASNLLQNYTAHGADGEAILGAASGGITPTGTISIDDDGTYDVTNYASADVAIDYVAKTVPMTVVNHSAEVVTVLYPFNNNVVATSGTNAGYISTLASSMTSGSTKTFRMPKGSSFVFFRKSGSATYNFELRIDNTVISPDAEFIKNISVSSSHKYKAYMLSASTFSGEGVTLDIYDNSDPWPVDITTSALSVSQNGVYTAPSGTAYTPVTVAVPSPFIVTLSYDSVNELWEPDCTWAQISDAYDNGDTILAQITSTQNVPPYSESIMCNMYCIEDGLHALTRVSFNIRYYQTDANESFYADVWELYGWQSSGITRLDISTLYERTSTDLTASGDTVTVPAGVYYDAETKSVASGTEGTPTATKGTVSNHAVTVTPSVTNSAGYISGGTHTGTGVSVSASELVSGSETKTSNGTYDVTNLASLVVAVPIVTYYTGTSDPSSSQGSNGDIYLKTVS